MSQVTHQELKSTPALLMLISFINVLLKKNKAINIEGHKKRYLMDSDSSNIFIFGRDQGLNPFIGVQEDMIPWFPEILWSEIAVSFENGYAYLISREKDGTIKSLLGLKVRRKRLIALIDKKSYKHGSNLNIKVFKILANKEVAISHKNIVLKNNIKITLIRDIQDIQEVDNITSPSNNNSIKEITEIYKVNLQGYDKEPTSFEAKKFFIDPVPTKEHSKLTISLINKAVMEGYGYNIDDKDFQRNFLPDFVSDYINQNNNTFNSSSETGTYKPVLNLKNNPNAGI